MKLTELEHKLLAAARAEVPSAAVPFAFEKRIMARLSSLRPADLWAAWSRALWQGAVVCSLVMLTLGLWTLQPERHAEGDLARAFERSLMASIDPQDETW